MEGTVFHCILYNAHIKLIDSSLEILKYYSPKIGYTANGGNTINLPSRQTKSKFFGDAGSFFWKTNYGYLIN